MSPTLCTLVPMMVLPETATVLPASAATVVYPAVLCVFRGAARTSPLESVIVPVALTVVTEMLEFFSSLLSLRLMKLLSSSEFVRGLFLAVTPMPLVVDLVIRVVMGSHGYYYNLYKIKGVVLATPLFIWNLLANCDGPGDLECVVVTLVDRIECCTA